MFVFVCFHLLIFVESAKKIHHSLIGLHEYLHTLSQFRVVHFGTNTEEVFIGCLAVVQAPEN